MKPPPAISPAATAVAKRKVAVFSTGFLPYSETFVYSELLHHRRYEAHVFCARRMHAEQFPHDNVFVGGGLYTVTRLCAAFDRQLETGGYSLIHAHFGTGAVYALPFARRHRLPLVVTFHGFDVPLLASGERLYPKYWPYALLGPPVLRHMTLGLCASIELLEMVRELGVPAQRLRLHHIGLDLDRFVSGVRDENQNDTENDTQDDRNPGREPRVVMVGRFVGKKGFVYGVRAFAEARRVMGRGRLSIIGGGELAPRIHAAAREEHVEAHVDFLGVLSHAEIADVLSMADVLLAPSVTTANGDRESGTMVVKEASASGTVPIGTWHGGIPEIIDDGVTGFLVPERDVQQMAARLVRVLSDHSLRKSMRAAGRAKMVEQYDNVNRVASLEDAYDDVLGVGKFVGRTDIGAPASVSQNEGRRENQNRGGEATDLA